MRCEVAYDERLSCITTHGACAATNISKEPPQRDISRDLEHHTQNTQQLPHRRLRRRRRRQHNNNNNKIKRRRRRRRREDVSSVCVKIMHTRERERERERERFRNRNREIEHAPPPLCVWLETCALPIMCVSSLCARLRDVLHTN